MTTATKVFPMMLHTEVINYVAEKIGAKSYLEIGVFNRGHNFDRINIDDKIGIDPAIENELNVFPMTSDEFFEQHHRDIARTEFDIIFIDGLHHSEQVHKDIINAWQTLNEWGVIVLHDTNPPTEITTCIPRGSQREWCGDVYKAIYQIDSPEKFTIQEDYGITILRKTEGSELKLNDTEISWAEFESCRELCLNLMSWEEAKKIIYNWK